MSSFVLITVSVFLLSVVGGIGWALIRLIREQAVLKRTLDVATLQVLLPKDVSLEERGEITIEGLRERIGVTEQFLSTLSSLPTSSWDRLLYGRPQVVFEIVARGDGLITFLAGTERRYLDHMEKQIYALYPDAEVRLAADYTLFNKGDSVQVGSVRLRRKEHLPIATYRELEVDPMQALTGALARIQNQDAAVIQFVCRPAKSAHRQKAQQAAKRTVQGLQGDVRGQSRTAQARDALFKNEAQREKAQQRASQLTPRNQELVELVEQKISQQQFEVNIRLGVATRSADETQRVFNGMAAAFAQYDLPDLNSLIVRRHGSAAKYIQDLVFRTPRDKTAITLSTTELASLYHFPLPTTETPTIAWRGARAAPAPPDLPREGVLLGHNVFRGIETPIYFAPDDRRRHLYMIGQTGTGKTTMFLNMIVQDIAAGHGVGVVDPHGDLIEDVLLHIPAERAQDVILFDPRDTERPLGFNILEVRDETQKDLVVNEVVQILQTLAARLNPESIGPMFEHYLRNALLALIEDKEATLIDVPRMFVDEEFRAVVLAKNSNPTVKQFWEREFVQSQRGQLSADMLSYVISKLGRFVSNKIIRNLIGQARSSFDVREVMDQRKILLCNLSKGSLGDINSDLLGFVLVSKLQIAALGRANVPEEQRPDFYLYLDEFQNFTTDSIITILSEARKYRLNLNLTHQFIQQLDATIRDAVFGNVGTIMSYRIGVDDTETLVKQFDPVFTEYDLVNLERFTACLRLLVAGTPRRAFSLRALSLPAQSNVSVRDVVRRHSRDTYGRSVVDVEERILERFRYGDTTAQQAGPPAGADYLSESLFDIS